MGPIARVIYSNSLTRHSILYSQIIRTVFVGHFAQFLCSYFERVAKCTIDELHANHHSRVLNSDSSLGRLALPLLAVCEELHMVGAEAEAKANADAEVHELLVEIHNITAEPEAGAVKDACT